MRWFLLCLGLTIGFAFGTSSRTQAAVVVVMNATDQPVKFQLSHPMGEVHNEELAPRECRPFPVGQNPEIAMTLGGMNVRYRLDPYTGYAFALNGEELIFQGIELAGELPKITDIPEKPDYKQKPFPITVRIFVDDAEARTRAVWEAALKRRFADVSALLEKQCGVTLDIVGTGTWSADASAVDLPSALRDFERKVKIPPAMLAVGYTSRLLKQEEGEHKGHVATFGTSNGVLSTHILMREGIPRTESERSETLMQEIGRWLGATYSPDLNSVMRPKLGDGRAVSAKFRIQFDPLNMLAANIWAEQLRSGKAKAFAALPDPSKDRLKVLYKTLAKIYPDDNLAGDLAFAIERAANRVAVAGPDVGAEPGLPKVEPKVEPKAAPNLVEPKVMPKADVPDNAIAPPKNDPPGTTEMKLSPRQAGVRKVVRAITIRASDLKRLPLTDRPKGDLLTKELVKAAADTALTLEEELRVPAFLIGLGIGLDDSTILRKNIVTRDLCRAAESEEERRDRISAIGVPTWRGRRDLCQHFVVSMTLTEIVGPTLAETAGITKELQDMIGVSGFSFIDLTADLAGISFASMLKKTPVSLKKVRDDFSTEAYMPDFGGLREGLNAKRFETDYGATDDQRFTDQLTQIRKRVADLPAYNGK